MDQGTLSKCCYERGMAFKFAGLGSLTRGYGGLLLKFWACANTYLVPRKMKLFEMMAITNVVGPNGLMKLQSCHLTKDLAFPYGQRVGSCDCRGASRTLRFLVLFDTVNQVSQTRAQ